MRASGELGPETAAALSAAATAARSQAATGVIVDLTAVRYLTLETLAPLLALARDCRDTGLTLRIHPSPAVRSKIRLTGLTALLPLRP
ncbi:STAS domain-containing protein [Prauserella sp. PE36]|uniref:STAS domain-containing protein n=1 Tax=Prauserella sp. PE36 TaxID=1504709 RepID=UPI001313E6D6|nr:STAS domain-containing protein [Prauserella sp. PE36]